MRNPAHKLLYNRLTIPLRPFYRRHPYRGRVSIASADYRGCIDLELGFFCNRVPKAANSTVTTTLARLSFGAEIPSKRAKKMFLSPAQLSAAQLPRFDELFKFAVVRNPYTRTLSAYLDKIERRRPAAAGRAGFADFLDRLENGALHANAHWAPQGDLLLIPRAQFDFIGKVENLAADLTLIQRRIRPAQPPEFKSFLANATGASERLWSYYDAALAARVARLYRADFAAFDYPTDFPPPAARA